MLVDLFELRIDLLNPTESLNASEFPKQVNRPVILTCRRSVDGGGYTGTERSRLALLKRMVTGDFAYIDIEDDVRKPDLEELAHNTGKRIIRSFHDLKSVPADLYRRVQLNARKGDIAKAAVNPESFDDMTKIFHAAEQLSHIPDKVVLGMGEFGVPTRILYKKTGSMLTFCSDPELMAGAAGHLSPEMMRNLYRAPMVTPETRIFGIIGNPVMHTASPGIHNPGFHRLGLDAVYVPFKVDDVRSFFRFADQFGVDGFSVTVPHKQHVLPYLGTISREVKQIGSCNTVMRRGHLWKGVNTDYYGFLHPIEEDLESGIIQSALVVGAGGAARSVVWALRNYRCNVTIVNRTFDRAEKLAAETGSTPISMDQVSEISPVDLVVQTTNVGMEPLEQGDPIPSYQFSGNEIVYDLVYKPKVTRLLHRAGLAGCRIVYGMEMLYAQGIQQFKMFTGFDYPDL